MVLKLCWVHAITVSFSPGFVLSNILNFSSNIHKYDYAVFSLLSVYIWWAFTGNCNNIKAIPILLYFPCYFIGNKFSVQSISFKEQFRFMIWPFLEIVFLDFSLSFGCISLFRILLSPFHGPSNTNHSILIRIRSFYDNSLFNYIDRNKCLYHPWYNEKLVIRLKMIGQ